MTKPKTHVVIVLDKSGSMASSKDATISGFNEQIQELKKNAAEQDIKVGLVTFDGDVYEHLWQVDAKDLVEADADTYQPDGMTAYYDAIGFAISKLKKTVEDDADTGYLVVVISDGHDNHSRHFQPSACKELIQACEKTGRWTFTFMGADVNQLAQVQQALGTAPSNMAAWSNKSAKGSALAFANVVSATRGYLGARSAGDFQTQGLYAAPSHGFADFTPPTPDAVAAAGLNLAAGVDNQVTGGVNLAQQALIQGTGQYFSQGGKVDLGLWKVELPQ